MRLNVTRTSDRHSSPEISNGKPSGNQEERFAPLCRTEDSDEAWIFSDRRVPGGYDW
jgi:hypothetical protein